MAISNTEASISVRLNTRCFSLMATQKYLLTCARADIGMIYDWFCEVSKRLKVSAFNTLRG
ncbi:hypothetical protein PsorP6_000317 [Peronosclerospora sorghi]|uniref:Uncharacterized protein n=1 Tax=Peronosclerospora sorghi TaxID=230839 RepID=A0ACC0WW45_9STRA|nr:hypothetical protein PsorP6_000317 [Peronosclerospora sorghi]